MKYLSHNLSLTRDDLRHAILTALGIGAGLLIASIGTDNPLFIFLGLAAVATAMFLGGPYLGIIAQKVINFALILADDLTRFTITAMAHFGALLTLAYLGRHHSLAFVVPLVALGVVGFLRWVEDLNRHYRQMRRANMGFHQSMPRAGMVNA